MKPTPRYYQADDVESVIEHHQKYQCVLGRAPTGSGKTITFAMLAERYSATGRVMILADMRRLVEQITSSVTRYTGVAPGIEMGESRANNGGIYGGDRVVVSTVQTQYTGEEGHERYRRFDPFEFSALLLDETELFLAPKAMSVVQWYCQNPNLRVCGLTATPFRSDGVSMANLFQSVAFDRDILWGIDDGWLVPVKQAFVRVSVDFSTLKIKQGEDGEEDFSAEEVAARITNENTMIELAKGILHVAGTKKTIVVAPTVSTAEAIAQYICAEKPGAAKAVHGKLPDDEREAIFDSHARGDFQFLTSVALLTKGYDDPTIEVVANCRKTRSKRLFQQILGRGVRPLPGVVDGPPTREARRAAIAACPKPYALMVNMVGVDADVRDCSVVDVLGNTDDERILARAKEISEAENCEVEDALAEAAADVESDRAAMEAEAEQAANLLEEEDEAQLMRTRIRVDAHVEVDYENDLKAGGIAGGSVDPALVPTRQLDILRRFKVPEGDIAKMSPQDIKALSRRLIARQKVGLCSYGQAKALRNAGYSRQEVEKMTRSDASATMDQLKANGWKRKAA